MWTLPYSFYSSCIRVIENLPIHSKKNTGTWASLPFTSIFLVPLKKTYPCRKILTSYLNNIFNEIVVINQIHQFLEEMSWSFVLQDKKLPEASQDQELTFFSIKLYVCQFTIDTLWVWKKNVERKVPRARSMALPGS